MGNMIDQNTTEFKPVNNLEVRKIVSNSEIPQSVNTDPLSEESIIPVPSVESKSHNREPQEKKTATITPNTPVISVGYPISQNNTEPSSIVLAKASGEMLPTAV